MWLADEDIFVPTPAGVLEKVQRGLERKSNAIRTMTWPLGRNGRDGTLLAGVYEPLGNENAPAIELFTDAANMMRFEWNLVDANNEAVDETIYETHFGMSPCAVITHSGIETEDSGLSRSLGEDGPQVSEQ